MEGQISPDLSPVLSLCMQTNKQSCRPRQFDVAEVRFLAFGSHKGV